MRNFSLSILLFLGIFATSCKSQHEKVLASKDVNLKLSKANEYYEQKKYFKANELFESVMPAFRGTKNYEDVYYRYCYSFYYQKDYLSASYQFKNFVDFFPKSNKAEECEFMYATCLYKLSNRYTLDQHSTYKTMEVLQTYINLHPNSTNLPLAYKYMEECRAKIELKDASAAKLYYNMGEFKSAIVVYNTLVQEYPDSKSLDLYHYMIMKSHYEYAKASVKDKQEERYAEVLNAYNELKDFTPNSNYIKDAESYTKTAQNIINQLRNEHK